MFWKSQRREMLLMKARFTPTWRSLVMCGLPRPEWSEKVLDDHLAARRSPPRSAGSACGLHRQRHARFGAPTGIAACVPLSFASKAPPKSHGFNYVVLLWCCLFMLAHPPVESWDEHKLARAQGKWAFTDPKFINILRNDLGFDGSIMTDAWWKGAGACRAKNSVLTIKFCCSWSGVRL